MPVEPGRTENENCQLISDDGSENYGSVKEFIKDSKHPAIQHLIAQRDIEFSNSMIEAANKKLKYNFLYHHHIANYEELVIYVEQSINDYNNRPNHVLHALTPLRCFTVKLQDQISMQPKFNNQGPTGWQKIKKSSAVTIVSDKQHLIFFKVDLL